MHQQKQNQEINKLFFFELKVVDFLIESLQQVQRNMRNITALWAKDLGFNEIEKANQMNGGVQTDEDKQEKNQKKGEQAKSSSIQDAKIHKYLLSLANFIEVERITLYAYYQQLVRTVTKQVEKKLDDHDSKLADVK